MITFSAAKPGDRGTIAALNNHDPLTINRLLAMGISPGVSVTLEQTFPAYILKVGHTRVSLDRETAFHIYFWPQTPEILPTHAGRDRRV